jgi:SAM-dependent methyltransferase
VIDERRLSFGSVAELYELVRPSYPQQLIEDVLALSAPAGGRLRALEVGAGTGKATTLVAAGGARIDALEPSPQMAAIARGKLAACPRVRVIETELESWSPDPADLTYDLLYSAQAWHWIDPAVRYRKARALLRAGGLLAAFWNRPDWERCELREAVEQAYRRHAPELQDGSPMRPGAAARSQESERWPQEIAAAGGFEDPEVRAYRWRTAYTSDGYAALLQTHSDHVVLAPERRSALIGAIAAAIDRAGGAFELPMITRLCLARAC